MAPAPRASVASWWIQVCNLGSNRPQHFFIFFPRFFGENPKNKKLFFCSKIIMVSFRKPSALGSDFHPLQSNPWCRHCLCNAYLLVFVFYKTSPPKKGDAKENVRKNSCCYEQIHFQIGKNTCCGNEKNTKTACRTKPSGSFHPETKWLHLGDWKNIITTG